MKIVGIVIGSWLVSSSYAMTPLNELEMSNEVGQSLLTLSNIGQNDVSNPMSGQSIGFYKVGLEATVEINANIRRLQLGCGGANGANGCDIDIDNMSLSGNPFLADGVTPNPACAGGRASCDAKLTNPFIQLAIKNPNSASTRKVVGVQLGAQNATGLLSTGTVNSVTPNGINTLSGFIRIQSDSTGYVYGKANTGARFLDARANAPYVINGANVTLNNEITGVINGAGIAELEIKTTGGGLQIPGMNRIPFIRPGVTVNNSRIRYLPLQATLNIPSIKPDFRGVYPVAGTTVYYNPVESPIDWGFTVPKEVDVQGGPLDAQITKCNSGCLLAAIAGVNVGDTLHNAFIKGSIVGITGDVTINQGLGYIHSLPVNSALSLSLQDRAIRWPNSYSGSNPERTNVDGSTNTNVPTTITDVAQKGWWLSLKDPVNLGSVDPVKDIDIAPLFPQIATLVSKDLHQQPYPSIGLGSLFNAIIGSGDINVTIKNPIDLSSNPLSLVLTDLQLSGQGFSHNCYGGLKFC